MASATATATATATVDSAVDGTAALVGKHMAETAAVAAVFDASLAYQTSMTTCRRRHHLLVSHSAAHRETLACRCPQEELPGAGEDEDQHHQMLAAAVEAVAVLPAADAAAAFGPAAVAIAVVAPCDDADCTVDPPRDVEETTICPWHRTDWAGLDCP